MHIKRLVAIALFLVTLAGLLMFAEPAKTKAIADVKADVKYMQTRLKNTQDLSLIAQVNQQINQFAPVQGCEVQPPASPPDPSLPAALTSQPITLDRFRNPTNSSINNATSTTKKLDYTPKEIIALAAASNYGERYFKDLSGKPVNNAPIIVLHETVAPSTSVINYFQSFQENEDNQASYHTLIALDGSIVYFVPPDKRAFGAGNSIFISSSGQEAIQTNPRYPSSVNNFAYHISLETPEDGMHNDYTHSGYTDAQYQSLAWLVAKTDVPLARITTHQIVDRSGSRIDPRSFNYNLFQKLLSDYPRTKEIEIGCKP
ncbi:N-acetylmuramoyl-L-alanine amidase [Pseudanabaena sp. FACHB-1998]|uniref:peptidoglycan recognition protein family protein n=1 Tax=Pseudanabaena sp. FACHB-1998 TaxID=2692858 RepID=UPI001680BB42|nr:peptidoglycan recognition family protein [Pseudanabaena sp. FACHB-1998]MBD2177510.1 N-acetylmuramoyl-L-alanine amidase [Pseudanabaena sp. FACHB-1998]